MTGRNGIAPRAKLAERPRADKGVLDAIADLEDYVTDPELGSTKTGLGGEALAETRKALVEGEDEKLGRALALLTRLEDRELKEPGRDIAENHRQTNGPGYLCTVVMLHDNVMCRIRERGRFG